MGSNKNSFLSVFFAKIFSALIITAVIIGLAFFGFKKFNERRYQKMSVLVEKETVRCAELCTVKTTYSEIVTLKKQAILGVARSYSIIRYSGIVRAGIADATQITTDISEDLKSITISLPHSTILGNEIRDFEIFDEQRNLFVKIDTADILSEIDKSRIETGEKLKEEGILDEADAHAETLFTNFFQAMGFETVELVFF